MFSREELLPEFVRFANVVYRRSQGWETPETFESAKERLTLFLADLKGRLAWELPLLCGFSVGNQLGQEIVEAFTKLETALAEATEGNVEPAYTQALGALLEKLRLAEALKDELPRITDVKIVNEFLILGSAFMDEQVDKAPLSQRFPLLLDWIERQDASWRTYLRLFPDQLYRVNKVLAAFEAMRSGAGGISLFLEGEDPDGLKGGLDIILKSLRVMAPAVETRFLTESERVEFSADLRLERVWRGADWPDWSGTSLAADLLTFYQEAQRDLARLASATLLPASWIEEAGPFLEELSPRFVAAFEELWSNLSLPEDQPSRPVRAEATAELERCRQELAEWQARAEEVLQPYYPLQAAALYSAFTGTLLGVLTETTADALLHAIVESVAEGKAQFQEAIESAADTYSSEGQGAPTEAAAQAANLASRFDLPSSSGSADLVFDTAYEVVQVGMDENSVAASSSTTTDSDEVSESEWEESEVTMGDANPALETAWEALQSQEQALEYLWSYLQTRDRHAIYQAFELFSEPFLALAELAPLETEQATEVTDISCPYCQESFSSTLDRCPGCRRLVTLQQRQPQALAPEVALETGSPILASLDRDTMTALGQGEVPARLLERWKDMARKLEAMGRAAKNENKSSQTEALLAKLVMDCHRVVAALSTQGEAYSQMRNGLFEDFARLEKSAKPTP